MFEFIQWRFSFVENPKWLSFTCETGLCAV